MVVESIRICNCAICNNNKHSSTISIIAVYDYSKLQSLVGRKSGWNSGDASVAVEGLMGRGNDGGVWGCEGPHHGKGLGRKNDFFHLKWRVLVHSKCTFSACVLARKMLTFCLKW